MSHGQAFAGGCPRGWYAITKSDIADLEFPVRGLLVPSNGTIKVKCLNGYDSTLPNLQAGSIIPGFFVRVYETGTTVTGTIHGGDDRVIED